MTRRLPVATSYLSSWRRRPAYLNSPVAAILGNKQNQRPGPSVCGPVMRFPPQFSFGHRRATQPRVPGSAAAARGARQAGLPGVGTRLHTLLCFCINAHAGLCARAAARCGVCAALREHELREELRELELREELREHELREHAGRPGSEAGPQLRGGGRGRQPLSVGGCQGV